MCRSHGGEWSWHSLAQDRSRLEALQVQKAVLGDKPGVDHFAFQIGEAIGDQRRHYTLGWSFC
jgi:hypothetical protein